MKKKKILLLGDDIRMNSGVSTMLREIVIGTSWKYDWVELGGVVKHPEEGKRLDLSEDTNKQAGINNSSVILYPISGYGTPDVVRNIIKTEKPDALMMMTDPRYFTWLFNIEQEIRKQIPIIYLNIWDDLPYPMYNKSFYESCDCLLAISKQTENINRVVLGESAKDKIIKYVPHGINSKHFYPIQKDNPEYLNLIDFKKKLFSGKEYDFTLLYNSRNIRRKSTSDLLLSFKLFIDNLPEDQAKKCAFVLHTDIQDENGTDLKAVCDMLFGENPKYNIIFSTAKQGVDGMRMLYNSCDVTALISSNEGWGLSLTESLMCGRPIIANVTGGMQDQMRFEDEKGNWIKFNSNFPSNHFGKYRMHGSWVYPVFPKSISIMGSLPTPYIYDDKANPDDVAFGLKYWYETNKELREIKGLEGRKWVLSDEAMMSSENMCKNIIEGIDETFEKFQPRYRFELIQVEPLKKPLHYTGNKIYNY
jgi:glycosyltransferase involved in cell wall biosynthesis